MRFFARLRRRVRSLVDRITGQPPAPEPPPPEPGRDYGGVIEREPSRLPPGWSLVGLYHQGEKVSRIHATDDTEVTDSEIHSADALIVWYEDAGDDGYRWVHGATGWDSLADQVEQVIIIVSPPPK